MKINYKITTYVLTAVLLVTCVWHWEDIFYHTILTNKGTHSMHQMPDGSMMKNTGNSMMDMTMEDMMIMMEGKTGKDLEKSFILGMIPHHEGAVTMAKTLLKDPTVSRELKKFANQIITAQEGEIRMMNEWLKKY